jgi:adenylate cyclase
MWKRRLGALLFGVVLVSGLVALRASDPYAVRVARETSFDVFQQLKPREAPPDLPVRIVDIDEASLAKFGQWPWSRAVMAQLTDRLTELGAAAIGFDVLFSEPDRLSAVDGADHDTLFAAALEKSRSALVLSRAVMGGAAPPPKSGFAMTGADPLPNLPPLDGVAAPLPQLLNAASGLGVASLDEDGAGIARRLPLLWSNGSAPLPTLSLEALRLAQGATTFVLLGDDNGAGTLDQVRVGDFTVPTDTHGELWLYYRPLPQHIFISAQDLLAADYLKLEPALAGHIVLVGTSAAGLLDIRASPLNEAVPGVSIHLQALEQMLTGSFLHRADWVGGLELLAITASAIAIALVLLLTGPVMGLLFSAMIAALTLAGSWFAFTQFRVLLDPSYTLFAALVTYAAMAFFQFAVTDADKRRIRRAFGHYIAPALLTRLEADESLLRLGGDLRDVTVMFSDVRNFTALSERTAPAELVDILNQLFAALGNAIIGRLGTIDKFMGDAVMAFWNAPADVPRHARMACEAALDMREALRQLNQARSAAEPISIGIGIATGPALVGNMGFAQRFDYSCIGETVNLGSRLESACKTLGYDILITEATRAGAEELAILPAGSIALKGMSAPQPVFLLVGGIIMAQTEGFKALAIRHRALLGALSRHEQVEAELQACGAAAAEIEPGLAAFYAALPDRLDNFATEPTLAVFSA